LDKNGAALEIKGWLADDILDTLTETGRTINE